MRPPQGLRVLYVTYDGLLEPLGRSQVLPYVRGLAAAGFDMSVLSFEKAEDLQRTAAVRALEDDLRSRAIGWTRLRYHRRPTLPATAWDVAAGRRRVAAWLRGAGAGRGRPVVHARGYVSGLVGLAGPARGAGLLFDMRGLWVEERIAGGYWSPGGLAARVGRWIERRLMARADHVVVLARRGGERLGGLTAGGAAPPWTVIPTCVDLERFRPPADRGEARTLLGLGPPPVLIHTGTLTGWYDGRVTMSVGAAFVRRTGGTFVVLTRDVEEARRLADECGFAPTIRSVDFEEIPRWLGAADAGLALPRISPSKDASYPTKIGEYLACGLAVLATPVGDVADLAGDGVLRIMEREAAADDAVEELVAAVEAPGREARARALAERHLGLEGGVRRLGELYERLARGDGA